MVHYLKHFLLCCDVESVAHSVHSFLQEKGDDLESASMCFEAGLKFLHVASLLEAPSIDSSKQGDSIQAMRLYSETGNLCG